MPRSLRSPNLIKKRRKKIIFRSVFFLSIVIFVIAGPVFLSRADFVTISSIKVLGSSVVRSDEIIELSKRHLTGNYFFLFPKSNTLLYPKKTIQKEIALNFPRVDDVKIKLSSLKSIQISITERNPQSLWCKDDTFSDCYFLDSRGFVFDKSPTFSPNVYFVYIGRLDDSPLGDYYLPQKEFDLMNRFLSGFRSLGLNLESLNHVVGETYELKLSTGVIFFSLRDDPEKVVSNLESVLSDPKLDVLHDGGLTVKSIDLQYGNKVILKKQE